MSCYRRPRLPGATVFFTVNLADRASDLLVREVVALRLAVMQTRADRPFRVDAWVVLPDHMHCIWTLPAGDADYATRMGAIKGRFSQAVRRSGFTPAPHSFNPYGVIAGRVRVGENPDLRAEAPIWQKRFWEHHIRDDADFVAHMEYCRNNPVKHGFVNDPLDWPYSSFTRRAGFTPPVPDESQAECDGAHAPDSTPTRRAGFTPPPPDEGQARV